MRTHRGFATAAAAFMLAVSLCACGDTGAPGAGGGDPSSAAVAVVNGERITLKDYMSEAANLSPYALDTLVDAETRQKFLDNLVAKKLIIQEAERAGMADDPEVVDKLRRTRENLLLGRYVEGEIFSKAKVDDGELRRYFDGHMDDLGSVRISHILVPTKKEAEDVLVKYKAGESFRDLARKYSKDTETSRKGGDLGYVNWAQFGSNSLRDTAFGLKPGEVSAVVRSRFGYHVIKVTDKRPADASGYDAVSEPLRQYLVDKKKEKLFDEAVDSLKEKADITTDTEALKEAPFLLPGAAAAPERPAAEETQQARP